MPTEELLRFRHIGLHVSDLNAALRFFRDGLQLEVLSRGKEDDPMAAAIIGPTSPALDCAILRFPETHVTIRLTENPGAPIVDTEARNPGTCHVAFYTGDLDRTWAHLDENGAHLVSDRVVSIVGGVFDGGKAIYCVGPDGYRIEFLEGPAYLDGSHRDPAAVPNTSRANEASHMGIHVRDRDKSLAFYRDLVGMEVVAAWLEETPSTRSVIGYPEASLNMAILRMPGTQSYFEVIEYQNVGGAPVDTHNSNNGTVHIAYDVSDLDALAQKLETFGSPMVTDGIVALVEGSRGLCCEDPDGIRVQFFERKG
jgi:lactoylglutathione lyase